MPALYLFTDPARLPDPFPAAAALPRGAAIVYRPFDAPDRLHIARTLRRLSARRGLRFLIRGDVALAIRVRADGVHLPEREQARAPALRRLRPDWLIAVAAHGPRALAAAARHGADAAFVSPVFATASHPGARAAGVRAAAAWARRSAPLPVLALGGVNLRTAQALRGPFAGLAAIAALAART